MFAFDPRRTFPLG